MAVSANVEGEVVKASEEGRDEYGQKRSCVYEKLAFAVEQNECSPWEHAAKREIQENQVTIQPPQQVYTP